MEKIFNYIDGAFEAPRTGQYLDNYDPSIGKVYSLIPDSDAHDVNKAVDAATRAFAAWSTTPAQERSRILLKVADLIDRDLDKLAMAESIDNGKPASLARKLDIPRASANIRFFATAILHNTNDAHITDAEAINYTTHAPSGVAGCISPWNLPL